MIWYRINEYATGGSIVPVEVIKETPQQVLVEEEFWGKKSQSRHNKAGEFFPTFAEAKDYRVATLERELGYARDKVSRMSQQLSDIKKLQEPVKS